MLIRVKTLFLGMIFFLSSSLTSSIVCAAGLMDFSDKSASIEDFFHNDKWTVVMIWASDCHVCNLEVPHYVKLHQRYEDKNIQVLGISMDGRNKKADAEDFIRRHAINFTNLWGEAEDVANLYSTQTGDAWLGTPTFLIYAPDGTLKAQQVGVLEPEIIEKFIQKQSLLR